MFPSRVTSDIALGMLSAKLSSFFEEPIYDILYSDGGSDYQRAPLCLLTNLLSGLV
jgi:hypothetical protein